MVTSLLSAYKAIGAPVAIDLTVRDVELLRRTLVGIIGSCLATIILCAWTAVHPNITPRNRWKALWNRLKLVLWMVFVPELGLVWAIRQLFAAKDIRDEYNKSHPGLPKWKKWTLAHGHLFEMGGYTLVDPDCKDVAPEERSGAVLTIESFRDDPNLDSNITLPEITEDEIQDWSKGDGLLKLIAVLQFSWFILQCVARRVEGLELTEIEIVTLALASINVVTSAVWWHKPLRKQVPVEIYLETEGKNEEDRSLSFGDIIFRGWRFVKELAVGIHLNLGSIGAFISIPFFLIFVTIFSFFFVFPLGIVLLLRIIRTEQETSQIRGLVAARIVASLQMICYRLSSAVGKFVGGSLEENIFQSNGRLAFLFGWFVLLPSLFLLLLLFTVFFTPFLALLFFFSSIFTAAFGIVATSPGASYVPSFYAPTTKSDRWSRVIFAPFGFIFGGLHCICWNFAYPTRSEQTLWRATSLVITFVPLVVAPIDFLLSTRLQNQDIKFCKIFERTALISLDLIMTILLFIYVPARLSIFAQALALLRNQAPSAFLAVDWTKYVPHLFSY